MQKNNQKFGRNVAIFIFYNSRKIITLTLRIFLISSLMINLAKLNIGRYYIADAVANVKKEKEIKIVQKLKSNLTPTYLLVKDTTLGPHSCNLLINIKADQCSR